MGIVSLLPGINAQAAHARATGLARFYVLLFQVIGAIVNANPLHTRCTEAEYARWLFSG
jgi:hypothetical protein